MPLSITMVIPSKRLDEIGLLIEEQVKHRKQDRGIPSHIREYSRRGAEIQHIQQEFSLDFRRRDNLSAPLPPESLHLQDSLLADLPLEAISPNSDLNCYHRRIYTDRKQYTTTCLARSPAEKLVGKRYQDWFWRENERAKLLQHLKQARQTPDGIISFTLEDLLPTWIQTTQRLPKKYKEKAAKVYPHLPDYMREILYLRDDLRRNTHTIMIALSSSKEQVNWLYWHARLLNFLNKKTI